MATIIGASRAVSAQGNSNVLHRGDRLSDDFGKGIHWATSVDAPRASMALRYSSASQSMLRCR